MVNEKSPPHDIEMEEKVLGCILVDPVKLYLVISDLKPNDFYLEAHEKIYGAILDIAAKNESIEVSTIIRKLKEKNITLSITFITHIQGSVATARNILTYSRIVIEKSQRRQFLDVIRTAEQAAYKEDIDTSDLVSFYQNKILDIEISRETKHDDVNSVIEDLKDSRGKFKKKYAEGERYVGFQTGFDALDQASEGIEPGRFWVIGGWHGTGKTSFALNIASTLINNKIPISFFTLEMSKVDIVAKMIGMQHGISSMMVIKGNNPEADAQVEQGMFDLYNKNFEIHAEHNLERIKLMIKKDARSKGTKVVFIDYLQKIVSDKVWEETPLASKASRELANLAQQENVAIVLLSQISNEAQRGNGAGAGFKGSGTIEASADMAIVLRREKKEETGDVVPVDCIITKNKYGIDTMLKIFFHKKSGKFSDRKYALTIYDKRDYN